ncbi:Putative Rieske (2Fe-2S) domain ferredoxin [Modestobacter italicus]|uniref:Cytochrome bc1 complex Rieske iron-sulfur subunit n=1 Tax=Modestobacter italicus (strain DSM 44449 / CECT 9708 / BC 501) TaxID=2732864 RepID=I4ES61_MODI5|nr:Rieske (2Fe-2S) protein [Modestobacter marinus]CCH86224.1 Putative Rieske (2Fe-2S) domain ferredoxin [Modestobacter marinus]
MHCFSRRDLLIAGGVGAGVVALSACGGGGDVPELTGVGPGDVVVPLSEVPAGGAYEVSIDGRRVVVSRPSEDTVVAFSARCTHQGCTVRAADEGLVCPCHGSVFDPADGAAVHGPATEPLAPVGVTVRGTDVVLT